MFDKTKSYFKFICAAGNFDEGEVYDLSYLFALAGADVIDIASDEACVEAAVRALKKANSSSRLCLSVGLGSDSHIQKALINKDKCTFCGECLKKCPQNAIGETFCVDSKRCIGCRACFCDAISYYDKETSWEKTAELLNKFEIPFVELHFQNPESEKLRAFFGFFNENFAGIISLCSGIEFFSNPANQDLFKEMASSNPQKIIIQADGISMSGHNSSDDGANAIRCAKVVLDSGLNVPIFISGGTNDKTPELLKKSGVEVAGISYGSYARKLVKNEIDFEISLMRAKELVSKVKNK